jgi:hypothetical protein
MQNPADELARRLAREAQAVCRHYLSNGCRAGRYWLVGDVANTPGRSLYVRLKGPDSGKGAAGKWTDAATGDHGDLLDVIRESRGLTDFHDVASEARRFLSRPRPEPQFDPSQHRASTPAGSPQSPRRLFAMSQPIAGTIAELYLRNRGITALHGTGNLRFHPRCYYRPDAYSPTETWPAMIAAVTDLDCKVTAAHRTWLDRLGRDKAPIGTPRRAMGHLLGNAVRFDVAHDVMAAGEGIETMLSLRCVMPTMPMVAALSAAHLAAILFPVTLRRLYIARDADPAGDGAMASLIDRANEDGIEAITLSPTLDDFNGDLRTLGIDALRAATRVQIAPETSLASWNWRHQPERKDEASCGAASHVASDRGVASLLCRREPRPRPSERAIRAANGSARQWRMADYFPSAASRLYIARQNSWPPPSSALLRPLPLRSTVQVRSARRLSSP